MARTQRASAAAAAQKIAAQSREDASEPTSRKRKQLADDEPADNGDAYAEEEDDEEEDEEEEEEAEQENHTRTRAKRSQPSLPCALDADTLDDRPKQQSMTTAATRDLCARLFATARPPGFSTAPAPPPLRRHTAAYHRPLLLDDAATRAALLAWYDATSDARGMPWRRSWTDPRRCTREDLAIRAYEVWISEVMAQQTRIPVVVGYWTRWMARWPTLDALSRAAPADVVAAWRGLGYYSRAARLHTAARAVAAASDLRGLLPADAAQLQARVPGVGRYTAGAISAIVFGRAAAMVDGNVVRVLVRQLGLWADARERVTVEVLWAAAEALVRVVAEDDEEGDEEDDDDDKDEVKNNSTSSTDATEKLSSRPGRWGQALMELGSTICTPKPNCAACPIRPTCRAYAEALPHKEATDRCGDMEDCSLCDPFTAPPTSRPAKRPSTSPYFSAAAAALPDPVEHARLFPLRRPKKAPRVLDTLVCAVRRPDGRFLLQRRPARGLLAGLWQLPSEDLEGKPPADLTRAALAAMNRLGIAAVATTPSTHLGTVPWLFSHIRQTMHVFVLDVADDGSAAETDPPAHCCWVAAEEADRGDAYTMGTGMRRCWDLVQEHVGEQCVPWTAQALLKQDACADHARIVR